MTTRIDQRRAKAVERLREIGERRATCLAALADVETALEGAIVAADKAGVPRRAIGREAGVVRQTVYNVLARRGVA